MFYFQYHVLRQQRIIGTSLLLIVFLFGKISFANPIIPLSGECPETTNNCVDSQGNFDKDCLRLQFEGNRQIILPKVHLYTEHNLEDTISNSQLVFRDKVTVLRENIGFLRASLVRAAGRRCGWIPENAILGSNKPLLVKDIRDVEGFESRDNQLNAKILIRNSPSKNVSASVPVYDEIGGREIGRLQIFGIYNIYTYKIKQNKTYFFVGGQKVTEDVVLEPVLLGWVKANDVIPWSSAMNLYYTPGKTNIPIYGSQKDAKKQDDPIANQGRTHIEPEKDNIPRFPVLDRRKVSRNVTVYKIAFAGEACIHQEKENECISARELANRRGKFGKKIMKGENIDILFVIDATESMRKYFKQIAKAVQYFAEEIASDANKIRFSAVIYGDYKYYNTPDSLQFIRAVPFSDTNNTKAIRRLVLVPSFDDPQRDYPEAAFAALVKAIKEANWRDVAGLRLVIWIGDHPNRQSDPISTNDVVDALKEKEAIWSAINVKGNYKKYLNDRFLSQARTISKQFDNWNIPIVQTYNSSYSQDSSTVRKRVKDKLHEIYDTSTHIAKKLVQITTGNISSSIDDNLPSAILAERYIKERLGISDRDMQDIYSRTQLVTQGFVRQDKNDHNFDFWISMRSPALNELNNQTRALCDALQYRSNFNDILDGMIKTLEVVTADKPNKTQKLRKFLSKRLHVPKDHFSQLLDKPLNEFVRWYLDPNTSKTDTTKFKSNICKKAAMLDQVKNNKRVDMNNMIFDKNRVKWVAKEGTVQEFNWMWGAENGIRYYYIPLAYIP